jgi:hypothetical protein
MNPTPSWKSCEDCCKARADIPHNQLNKIANINNLSCGSQYRELYGTVNLSTLCNKCISITPCSVCKKIIPDADEDVRLEISHWNEEPICTTCKDRQCYRCGEEGYEKTWYGWALCEECGMVLCNNCDGEECNEPCSKCERPCDYDCSCSEDEDEEDEDDEDEDS